MLDIMSGDKCAVCIKILDIDESPKDIIMVRTFMRDSSSYRERKSSDKSIYQYPYYENTAFKTILSRSPDSYYASDSLCTETTYVNANNKWQKFYNSTLVCPIRMELVDEMETQDTDYSILGFICVDNLKGGLNNRACIQLLASVSDSLYNHFLMFNTVRGAIFDAPADQLEKEAKKT